MLILKSSGGTKIVEKWSKKLTKGGAGKRGDWTNVSGEELLFLSLGNSILARVT